MMTYKHRGLALFCLALASLSTSRADAESVTIFMSGGAYADAQIEAFVKPFEAETGITVNAIKSEVPTAKMILAVQTGTVDFDLCIKDEGDGILLDRLGYLVPIDYSLYDPKEIEGLAPGMRPKWGVADTVATFVLSYNIEALKGKPQPKSWADFWNVDKFPGSRTMQGLTNGTQGPLEEALLADGVAAKDLYPLDVERAFRKLDQIKPNIRKWWANGSEVMQLFNANIADMGMNFDGRVFALKKAGKPIELTFNEAKYYATYWVIPKGAKNVAAAQKFAEYATRARQQGKMAMISGFSPPNTNAYRYIEPDLAKNLVTFPDNIKTAYAKNAEWYAAVGADGKSNAERLIERWNEWIAK
ncbi:putative spermidine/putrescine transport system substrate-binding protein [Rhizobiales bacterium GAS113]|nr:putative spermidine/putrescine transport system substrate-binding protein [Rhizobiales bacterium GAS113]